MWLTAATLHLQGDAAHWFQSYKLKHAVQGWPDFITAVEAKFGVHDYREFMDELLALKQGGTILDKDHAGDPRVLSRSFTASQPDR
jgi:hypothetical protein